jgi:FtsZ-binding cell division protein ZapB
MANKEMARKVDPEPIDRLEDKIRRLVDVVTELRAEETKSADEQARLTQEVDGLRTRLSETDGASGELTALRQERDVIRDRVAGMLEQLEGLNV